MLLTTPSFYGLIFTGIMSLIVILLFIQNYSKIKDVQSRMAAISLIGILVGIHSLLHLGMEAVYNYNPIQQLRVYANS